MSEENSGVRRVKSTEVMDQLNKGSLVKSFVNMLQPICKSADIVEVSEPVSDCRESQNFTLVSVE